MYLKMLNLEKVKSMKSSLSEDLLEFQKFNNFFKNSSMEKLLINQSTQMKQSLMELLFKLPFLLDKVTKKLKSFYFLMLPHFLLELKQLEVSWLTSLTETQPFQLKRIKSSLLIKITNQESRSKYLKEKERWLKIITCLVNLI